MCIPTVHERYSVKQILRHGSKVLFHLEPKEQKTFKGDITVTYSSKLDESAKPLLSLLRKNWKSEKIWKIAQANFYKESVPDQATDEGKIHRTVTSIMTKFDALVNTSFKQLKTMCDMPESTLSKTYMKAKYLLSLEQ